MNDVTIPSRTSPNTSRQTVAHNHVWARADGIWVCATGHTQFTNDLECVRREAQRLKKQGVHIIIALGHSGLDEDKRIAFEVPLVDIVVGGNSHYFMFSESPLSHPPEPVYGPYPVVIQRPDGTQVRRT
ncbi:hypothetical protein HPB51_000983 [Rhipicephalus microplus]|uniref:5'-nucleotidase n=1 Tax=Rhipicephalus microplus TaxID=6941 RepID=A0A9J6DEK9_RHIMP|nr:hypothetical protein HPB51_000983 [Rhipicephalus microplus]